MTRRIWLLILTPLLAATACERLSGGSAAIAQEEHRPVHVDSVFPIDEELRRFRAELQPVDSLTGGADSRDELVRRFGAAVAAGDAAALRALAITVEEFAWLYYPHTRYTRPPYELGPAIVWFQLENYGGRGLSRLLNRYGRRPFSGTGHACSAEPIVEERNTIWADCVIRYTDPNGHNAEASLFGAILERDGRFKFVSYANRLPAS